MLINGAFLEYQFVGITRLTGFLHYQGLIKLHFKVRQKINRTRTQTGFIAQDVEKVFPEWIHTDPDGYKGIDSRGFDALATEAIKELRSELEGLKREVHTLKAENKALHQQMNEKKTP